MEWIGLISIWIGIALYKASVRYRMARSEMKTLCLACTNALVTRTSRSNVLVNCIYGGAVRPVKVAVCECTGYAPRGAGGKLVTIEGFVRDEPVVYEEVAIR
jgi:hypothetical protein